MKDYRISQVTKGAKALQAAYVDGVGGRKRQALEPADFTNPDRVDANYLNTRPLGASTEVMQVCDLGFLILGDERIDIRMLHDIASVPQLNAIAFLLRRLMGALNPLERFQRFMIPGAAAEESSRTGRVPREKRSLHPDGSVWRKRWTVCWRKSGSRGWSLPFPFLCGMRKMDGAAQKI